MRPVFTCCLVLILLGACKQKQVQQPACVQTSRNMVVPGEILSFVSAEKNWQARLAGFVQPLALQISYQSNGFAVSLENPAGIIEGPAQVVLSNQGKQFYYDVFIRNASPGTVTETVYRSPKTVNPDSSLVQHRMEHYIDQWRNLQKQTKATDYFQEVLVTLQPNAGTFRDQRWNPLSAYYVQPGSAQTIRITAVYDRIYDMYTVKAGPLSDQHNNTVANGTSVVFVINDRERTYRMETAVYGGVALAGIPGKYKGCLLQAVINTIHSSTIQLLP